MKNRLLQSVALGLLFVATAAMATAGTHQTPTAPEDWLAKTNPYDVEDVDDDFLKAGKKLYKRKCKKCHGAKGDGKGTAAKNLTIQPTAFSKPGYLAERQDGQLFWILMKGSEGTDMESFGPGTDVNLSEDQLWQLITYLRSDFSK